MGEAGCGGQRTADLWGLARYIMTKKGIVRDRQRGQEQSKVVAVVTEYDRGTKSEAYSGPLKSGIIIFK